MKRAVFAGAFALAACSNPPLLEKALPTDIIKDAATAIRMGQEACLAAPALPGAQKETGWYARLNKRVWHVALRGEACESFGSDLDAATGKQIGTCSFCLT
jgi:hypothetical protein